MTFLRNIGSLLVRGLRTTSDSGFPRWPSIPRTGIAREGYEIVLLTMFSGMGTLVRAKGLSPREALPVVKELATQVLQAESDDEFLAVNIFTKAHHGQGNLVKAFERFEAYSDGSPKLRRAAFETFLYIDSLLPGANFEVETFLTFMADSLALSEEFEAFRATQKEEVSARKAAEINAETKRSEAVAEGVKRLRTKVKEATASMIDRSYLTLESAAEDPIEVIEERYRKLVFAFHPDLAKGRGESLEAIQEKRKRFQAILKAFATVQRERKGRSQAR